LESESHGKKEGKSKKKGVDKLSEDVILVQPKEILIVSKSYF
jgi:hypothetical protein